MGQVRGCRGLCIDADDQLWVISTTSDQLLTLDTDGNRRVVVAGTPFDFPLAVAVAADGTAYVSDSYRSTIWKVSADGAPEEFAKSGPLQRPVGLCTENEQLLVADPGAQAVLRIDAAGNITVAVQRAAE